MSTAKKINNQAHQKMKKIINSLLNERQIGSLALRVGKAKAVLMGRDFLPLPSYWALTPLKPENNMPGRAKVDYKNSGPNFKIDHLK